MRALAVLACAAPVLVVASVVVLTRGSTPGPPAAQAQTPPRAPRPAPLPARTCRAAQLNVSRAGVAPLLGTVHVGLRLHATGPACTIRSGAATVVARHGHRFVTLGALGRDGWNRPGLGLPSGATRQLAIGLDRPHRCVGHRGSRPRVPLYLRYGRSLFPLPGARVPIGLLGCRGVLREADGLRLHLVLG